jgi:serine/threonine protein kinase/tetratricopeptide (TPR) repeat protein
VSENYDDKTRTYVPLTSGTMVSHYRILEKIGAGGMGEVYLAEDTKLNRKVALKFLPVHACQDPNRRARFTREAQAAAKLNHPHIVTIHEVSEFNGQPFFAMENVDGQTFRDLGKSKELPLSRIIELAIQVSEGLAKAHTAGIVHRDIKPSNILIDQDGRAKIVDFGLASIHGSEHLTKTGSTLGTVGYMSPEQARGEEADARSDLFSFGVVLYELIAGRPPFKAESDVATVKNIVEAVPEPLARYKNDVPDDLQRIIDKLLAKNRSLRYQHADDLATDLKRLISSVSTSPIPVKRKRRIVVLSLVILGVLVTIWVMKPWRMMTAVSNDATDPERVLVLKLADDTKITDRVVVVPFRNQTSDPSLDPLGKMVADWIIQSITQIGKIDVVRPEVSLGLDSSRGIRAIAAGTGATKIVTGSYYKLGDSIQFQVQVNDAEEKLLSPVMPICVSASEVMDGVEEVRQRVMGALAMGGKIYRAPKYEAYLQYQQGFEIFHRKADNAGSIPYFARAYALDSTFNFPLRYMFWAYSNLEQYAQADSILEILESRRSQMTSREQFRLDEQKARLAGDWMSVLALYRAENQEFPPTANWYMVGWSAIAVNHPNEAVEAFKKAYAEGQWVWYWVNFATTYHLLGHHEEELQTIREGRRRFPTIVEVYNAEITTLAATGETSELRRLIEDRPTFPGSSTTAGSMRAAAIELRAHGHEDEAMKLLDAAIRWYEAQPAEEMVDAVKEGYALTLYHARRWDKAKAIYQELAKISPRDAVKGRVYAIYLGSIAARQGDRASAMEVSEWLRNVKEPYLYGGLTYARASIAAILGEKEQAMALLKKSFSQGLQFGIEIHRDFDLESLWNYPPFIELLKPKG